MKNNRQIKIVAVALMICMLASFAACGANGQTTNGQASNGQGTVTPVADNSAITYVNTYADLMKAQPGIVMNDAPAGSTGVQYGWLNNIPVINQISFTNNGYGYVYRAAACPGGVASADISNVSSDLKSVTTVEIKTPNEAGGTYVLRYNPETGEGVANWTLGLSKCQYSLYTKNGCLGDIQSMPMTQIMKSIYVAAPDVKVATGNTVLALSSNTLTITTSAGTSAVIDCSNISSMNVAAGDVVDIAYTGDLAGNAYAIRITKTGQATPETANVISGTVWSVSGNMFYLLTPDSNVYSITVNGSTKISGVASALAANQEVKVQYSGDLRSSPVAVTIQITKQGTTPTPVPTSSVYVERTVSGYITSVAGYYVTVSGKVFTVNSSQCYVVGTPVVGQYATINYNDYGTYTIVTSAYFSTPTPTPQPYTNRTCCGVIQYANGIWIGIEGGYEFTVNSANCAVSGKAEVGGYARIDYRDYGYGKYEVTSASFFPKDQDTPERCYDYGTVDGYPGSTVSIGGVTYIINSSTVQAGIPEQRGTADITYDLYSDGRKVAVAIQYYPAQQQQDTPQRCYDYGTVDSYPGSTVSIGGVSYEITGATVQAGTPEQRGTADITYDLYSNGRKVAVSIQYYPAQKQQEDDPVLYSTNPADYNYDVYEGQGDLIDDDDDFDW